MRTRKDTDRSRTWAARKKRGAIVCPVEIQRADFTAALAKRGIVQSGMPVTRDELAAHAGAVLRLWSESEKG